MPDLSSYLPAWIMSAAMPASAVIAFFWKGDDALSPEFRKWLTDSIIKLDVSVRNAPLLEVLSQVMNKVYKANPRSFPSLLRVSTISLVFVVSLLVYILVYNYINLEGMPNFEAVIRMLSINNLPFLAFSIFMDYISAYKSIVIMHRVVNSSHWSKMASFMVIDFTLTVVIVLAYTAAGILSATFLPDFDKGSAGPLLYLSFALTTFVNFLLTLVFSLSQKLLRLLFAQPSGADDAGHSRAWALIVWSLPVQSLPVRSVGILSGSITFFLSLIAQILG
jgi:hypothetical protein